MNISERIMAAVGWVIAIGLALFFVPVAVVIIPLQWCLLEFRAWLTAAASLALATLPSRHPRGRRVPQNRRRSSQGRHRKARSLRQLASEHGGRLASFSLIGFGVFAAGLVIQVLSVQVAHMPPVSAYVMQLVLCVQVNFLANYRWTWGDRTSPFWRSCWRYSIKRAGGALLSLGLYPVLIRFGMNYLVANAMLVAGLTPANYLLGHFWTFADGGDQVVRRFT